MSEASSVTVNFGRPMPIFPLDSVALLPQQVIPLHIFEPRYRQMIDHALDSAGQIAMATFAGTTWKQQYHGNPPVRRAVCIGQIVQHERLPDGRFNLLLQGVCRANIRESFMPDADRLYRTALLEPNGVEQGEAEHLTPLRDWIGEQLREGPLAKHALADKVLEYVGNDDVATPAVLELVSFALIQDPRTRYRLLAEGDVDERAGTLRRGLEELGRLIRLAGQQGSGEWPKGLSWN